MAVTHGTCRFTPIALNGSATLRVDPLGLRMGWFVPNREGRVFRFDPTRLDLAREYRARPFGVA